MRREYAQEPPIVSVVQLNSAECEIILRENVTTETREGGDMGPEAGQITVYLADEYTIIVPWREGLEEAVKANISEWLTIARKREVDELLPGKLAEITAACHAAIVNGCTVTVTGGSIEHFSLEETDQINLNAAYSAVEQGADGYPYHADGQLCRIYPAADIIAIATAATAHKLYHTTYCNHLLMWARRATSADELTTIFYGATLPEDLATNMAQVIADASGN